MILDIMVLKDVFVQFSDSWEKQNIKTASCQLMVSISFYVLCSSIPLIFLQGPISSDCPAVADRLLPGAWKSTEIYGSRWKCQKIYGSRWKCRKYMAEPCVGRGNCGKLNNLSFHVTSWASLCKSVQCTQTIIIMQVCRLQYDQLHSNVC